MPTQINALNCKKLVLGTGLVPCEIRLRQPKSILRVGPDWTFNPNVETFNLTYVISQIQRGVFTPILNVLEFLNNTPDPTTKEYQGGATANIRNSKPMYSFEYDNGIAWHKALYALNGFRSSSVIIIDKVGNVWFMSNVAGTILSGFLTNVFNTRTYVPEVGDETAKTLLEFQIDNEEAFNTRLSVITADIVGADLNEEIRGIVGVTITGTASAGDPIEIQVNAVNNTIYGIQGLTASDLRVRNYVTNEVVELASVVPGITPGSYTITPEDATVANQNLIVETYDALNEVNVALIGTNQLYKGESELITVAA